MKLDEILKSAAIEPQEVLGSKAETQEIADIVLDSRKAGKEVLFVAQSGTNVDGHDFIGKAIENGSTAIVCEKFEGEVPEGVTIVVCKDTHEDLGHIASAFFRHPSREMKVVGVTGTNGKTTIATLLYKLVMKMNRRAGLFSTVANYVVEERTTAMQTTPDAITLHRQMRRMKDAGCEYCFMEVSSHSVVQKRIAGIEFDGGIFTNLTHDHLDFHKTFAAYINAKKGFFDSLSKEAFALTNSDDKNGSKMIQNTRARKRTYALQTMADYKGKLVEDSIDGMRMDFNGCEAHMLFCGRFNAYNLLAIYGAALELGFEGSEVLTALSGLRPVNGRFEPHRTSKGATAIVDYAHTPDALLNVLSTINKIRRGNGNRSKLIAVVGCGGDRDRTKRPEMAHEAAKGADYVILTSDNPRSENPQDIINDMLVGLTDEEKARTTVIVDRREAIRKASEMSVTGDIILVAGKGHEDYQEIKGVKHHFSDREEVEQL